MSVPDLSFLDPAAHRSAPPAPTPAAPCDASLVAELERQNKVLRYSQAVAESACERFETLFARVPLALMVLDEHDMVVQANSMAQRSFQPGERDRPLTALMPFVRAQDAQRVRAAFAQAAEQGHSEAKEVVFPIGEGTWITGDLHITRIEAPQSDGPPRPQFLCAVIDQGPLLAERQALRQRNEQLHASEQRLAAVIDAAFDAILCVDRNQRITVFNPTAAALFECPAGDALGSKLERFLPDVVLAQRGPHEMRARTAGGKELSVEVGVAFEHHAQGESTTVFARDLSGRKKAEAQRSALEAQLREAHKMQAMGTLAGGIAHDFNNILGAILGNLELAKADCAPGSPVRDSLLEIDQAARRARDLVRQILTFSRNDPPRRAAVALADVVHDTGRLLRVSLPPAIALHMQLPAGLPPILADATQAEQALLNLCTNAVYAIGAQRGSIHVEASTVRPDQRLIKRLGLACSDYVALSVRDSGPGMDAATQERIFEPFFTTKPVGQGTGLGLAVVHGVMRTHEGAVDVHSAPGQGSRFTLYFPLAPQGTPAAQPLQTAPEPVAPSAPGAALHRKRHVMYVDDDPALVNLMQRLLRREGYEVSGHTDPHAATAALRADPWAYDLLVTDYSMPGFCGVDLVRTARRIRPDLPVALASGYITAEIEQAALAEGARALIHKPDDLQELCATVRRLVGGNDTP
ncbi:PAS domain-containing sensor histidine kinase [Verminephrobacter aporrectodeae subsp. tuberculatae]|uniref:histidine kinase n=1 Tax=Verminephrobacter aporrectodeae subsp. tuberculatae TaxID=1110392 RepID=A0ABT3KPR9_9BURK|nr:PAS domain-containing sensor histidine kinase [Verminephrobacter aporrectodeae]MCW5220720.1 PAS domain-containing sensor histidine kinase [Verminephrobacter aporrectodeae subsp. tuberculatae]MCW5255326.1 PAS domain-containing sensor histidine kinase [Verminephrobacter aporrectodeae subsp. tuberculatae]MCW5290015.1 PAS domain-containing sensor histidine kinase [Verminephrobacter aporrectodeae subsp. tuberculatae]MCW5320312.1 PAS domain-containing sensor histidine kinase [Verminephrobacter apo